MSSKLAIDKTSSNSFIINDEKVQEYLQNCEIPVEGQDVELNKSLRHKIDYANSREIKYIITVDSTRNTIPVKKSFPSSLITFFQFGSLLIEYDQLKKLENEPFIAPTDIKELKNIKREKLVIPTKNIILKKEEDFETTVRNAIQSFFKEKHMSRKYTLLSTLYWFIFEEYNENSNVSYYPLSNCPHCNELGIRLHKDEMDKKDYSWTCPHTETCGEKILITDVFNLFKSIDNDAGAGGILGYLENIIESFLLVHTIRAILETKSGFINEFLFIKNSPLHFGGAPAPIHKPMQKFITYFRKTNDINIVGVENTGSFVEHTKAIKDKINDGEVFLLSNEHIFNYIKPPTTTNQYGTTFYYSGKFIYKSKDKRLYVLTIPVENHSLYYNVPSISDLPNLEVILKTVDLLKCDIYNESLIPLAISNKLISITNYPSSNVLERLARKSVEQ